MTAVVGKSSEGLSLAKWLESRLNASGPSEGLLRKGPAPLPHHVGLWLDRGLIPIQGEKGESKGEQIGRDALYATALRSLQLQPEGPGLAAYKTFFARHCRESRAISPGVRRVVLELEATSRILLHPSTGTSVTDGSLLLHHTYGVPYLPGSALKGICRARTAADRRLSEAQVHALFGWAPEPEFRACRQGESPAHAGSEAKLEANVQSHSGLFDFWDALWIPEPPVRGEPFTPFALDVVTPHHRSYYTAVDAGERQPPQESDSPVPVKLLTYAPKTRFLLVVEHVATAGIEPWLKWMVECLLDALEQDGIGAKTAAGYGRLRSLTPRGSTGASTNTGAGAGGAGEAGTVEGLAMVSRQKNDGTLIAQLLEGGRAEARGIHARTLYEKLSDELRARLDRGKDVRLRVLWSREGNSRRLDAILEV